MKYFQYKNNIFITSINNIKIKDPRIFHLLHLIIIINLYIYIYIYIYVYIYIYTYIPNNPDDYITWIV